MSLTDDIIWCQFSLHVSSCWSKNAIDLMSFRCQLFSWLLLDTDNSVADKERIHGNLMRLAAVSGLCSY